MTNSAILFYGYLEPERDDPEQETAWDAAHATSKMGCTVGIYGHGDTLRCYLAVEASVHEARYDAVTYIPLWGLQVKSQWPRQLEAAAHAFGLDGKDLLPGWYLVSLSTV